MFVREKNIVLMQGVFESSLFDLISKRKDKDYFILEGRPGLEAAKQSSCEFLKRNIQPTVISDNMAGFLFYRNLVKEVWLSYQMVNAKGALCQIGGLILGVLGYRHKIPVYLYPSPLNRQMIASQKKIKCFNGVRVVTGRISGYVPLLEWVPKKYIGKVYGKQPAPKS
ncbi:MAG: hypothetical protein JW847_03365 [Candidatus Omnitrophica bacterium]|nr:hypothetical protein [Candidatus Omnitrophota bacterium]